MTNDEPTAPPTTIAATPQPQPAGEPPAPGPAATGPAPRQLRLLLIGVAIAAVAALLWPRSDRAAKPGGFLVDAGGQTQPLAQQLAPVTLLHFWSTWCPPCIEEAPAIDRLADDLDGDPRFSVLMVAVADEVAQVRKFAGVRADRVLYDPKWEVAHRYGTRQLPETYLLVGGKVTRKFVGATDWDDPQIRAVVERAIAAAPSAG
jgi:thiol-disulfide isomerase/thioredoxin